MVKGRIRPTLGGMAGFALRAKLTCVRIVLCMAGNTICRCVLEIRIFMAAFACNNGVFPFEFECELRMIHCPVPAIRCVTGSAVGSKLTVMLVILRMA